MSREDFVRCIYEHNLVTYYLLPLLGINQFNFGQDNFVNAFADADGEYLYVHVKDLHAIEDPYWNNWFYQSVVADGKTLLVFRFPAKWKATFELFREGKYSEFTKAAKSTIIRNSGLRWKFPLVDEFDLNSPPTIVSDARLLALNRTEALQRDLADALNVDPSILRNQELIAPPKESEFIRVTL